jgi:hypothetical protein
MGAFSNTFSNTFSRGMSIQGALSEDLPSGIYLTSLEDEYLTEVGDENILLTEIE